MVVVAAAVAGRVRLGVGVGERRRRLGPKRGVACVAELAAAVQTARRLYSDGTTRSRARERGAETEIEGNENKSNRRQEEGARGQTAVGWRDRGRRSAPVTKAKERGSASVREGRERVRAEQGTVAGRESGATRGRRSAAPRRPPPPPGSAFRISSRSVLGGFSQSADAPRNAVIISIVCSPFLEGEGAFPPHSRVSPLSLFHLPYHSSSRSVTPLPLSRASVSRAYARAASVQPPCASSPPLARTH